jgi:hypothetical protein
MHLNANKYICCPSANTTDAPRQKMQTEERVAWKLLLVLRGCWAAGLLGCWAAGLLGCWAAGLLTPQLPGGQFAPQLPGGQFAPQLPGGQFATKLPGGQFDTSTELWSAFGIRQKY